KETRRQGDRETRRQGDKETRRQGDRETRRHSKCGPTCRVGSYHDPGRYRPRLTTHHSPLTTHRQFLMRWRMTCSSFSSRPMRTQLDSKTVASITSNCLSIVLSLRKEAAPAVARVGRGKS